MYNYTAGNDPDLAEMPQAVELEDGDSPQLRQLKQLIHEMTSYNRAERPSASEVLIRLAQITVHIMRLSTLGWFRAAHTPLAERALSGSYMYVYTVANVC